MWFLAMCSGVPSVKWRERCYMIRIIINVVNVIQFGNKYDDCVVFLLKYNFTRHSIFNHK